MATSLGELISAGRKQKQMSLRDLAGRLGLSPSFLNDVEHNRRVPSAANISAISDALELDANSLMAAAGRVGDHAEQYVKSEPLAGALLRTAASGSMSAAELEKLIQSAQKIIDNRQPE
jgi:transcriptional regulator with XRE-family HTH domain